MRLLQKPKHADSRGLVARCQGLVGVAHQSVQRCPGPAAGCGSGSGVIPGVGKM